MPDFGLSGAVREGLSRVFARYPAIRQVLIFGSRAKGNYRDGSDIDLAVLAPDMDADSFTRLWNEIDALPLVFKVDCLHWDTLGNEALKAKILEEGQGFLAYRDSARTGIRST
ncbi:MAG: nucleotidyltransferase domain-containing protein [Rhodocyclaceae bacterium]|nr:nucleotidyltransferase domain-containing protein [Rhodocyclaceae bacterium]